MDGLSGYFAVSAALLGIGVYGLMVKRNPIRLLFAVEIVYNAANLNIIAFARFQQTPLVTGQALVFFSIALAAMEAAVGLAIFLVAFRLHGELDVGKLTRLKG